MEKTASFVYNPAGRVPAPPQLTDPPAFFSLF
jgi:hypothetical protein